MAIKIEKVTFTINEFCQYYGICRTTFYRLKKENNIPPLRQIGRKFFIKKMDADIWFESIKIGNKHD
jgi:excisionase family DNA binding protein